MGNAPAARFRVTRTHVWLGLPVFIVLWKNLQFPLPLVDFWWHLKMGEVIVGTGSIPDTDLFSFTALGKPFVLQNWLAEVAYYGMYRLGGLPLIAFLNALMVLVAFLLLYFLCFRVASRPHVVIAVGIVAALAIPGTIRPQVFSYPLFAFYYLALMLYRQRARDLLWTLPPLMVLWVNLHGAFFLGVVLLAVVGASEWWRRLIHDDKTDALTPAELRKLAFTLGLCVLASLANPEGYKIYDYVRTVMTDPVVRQLTSEWQPPRIDEASAFVVFYVPFFAALLALIGSRSRPDLTEVALFVAFALLGLMALRNGPWFSIVAYPLLARYASDLDFTSLRSLRRFGFIDRLARHLEQRSAKGTTNPRMNLVLATVALFVLVLQTPWVRPTAYRTSLVQEGTPTGAMEFIAQHRLEGNIFHPQMFGDYLIWRLWPQQKSFIDGRVHLFGFDFVNKYLSMSADSDWQSALNEWNIRYLLLSKSSGQPDTARMAQVARVSSQWRVLYEDDVSVLLEQASIASTR